MENVRPEYFVAGFRTCGLFPFSADGIDYTKLISSKADENAAEDRGSSERSLRLVFDASASC